MPAIRTGPSGESPTPPTTRRGDGLLIAVAIVALLAGAFFRFHNLDRKIYWNDEVWTSLWLSGHRGAEVVDLLFDGRELTVEGLLQYQRVDPARGWTATLAAVAADDPKQGPVYYVLARLWAALFGDSVGALRGLSAGISLFAFPALYWLCRELFAGRRTAWMAVGLLALSPFHLLYAQEARPYSLFTVMIIVASAAFLRAMRRQTTWGWSLYAATVAAGLYTHTLFGLIVLAHAVCAIALRRRGQLSPDAVVAYRWSTIVALAGFLPWAYVIAAGTPTIVANTGWILLWDGIPSLVARWFVACSAPFFDLGRGARDPLTLLLGGGLILLCAVAVHDLRARSSPQAWLFVGSLMAIPALALMLPDLLLGGRLISAPRFLIPCLLGLQLALSRLLGERAFAPDARHRSAWLGVTAGVLLCGVVSAVASAQAQSWWNKYFSGYNLDAARIINRAPRPLLISDASGPNPRNVISLSYRLSPDVRIRLIDTARDVPIPELDGDVFLFGASPRTRQKLELAGYRIEELDRRSGLSRLVR